MLDGGKQTESIATPPINFIMSSKEVGPPRSPEKDWHGSPETFLSCRTGAGTGTKFITNHSCRAFLNDGSTPPGGDRSLSGRVTKQRDRNYRQIKCSQPLSSAVMLTPSASLRINSAKHLAVSERFFGYASE